jgi:hypothetical protein
VVGAQPGGQEPALLLCQLAAGALTLHIDVKVHEELQNTACVLRCLLATPGHIAPHQMKEAVTCAA